MNLATVLNTKATCADANASRHRDELRRDTDVTRLHSTVLAIAGWEAQARLYRYAAIIADTTPEHLPEWLMTESLRSTGDTWSGRNNDFLRSIRNDELDALRQIERSYRLQAVEAS